MLVRLFSMWLRLCTRTRSDTVQSLASVVAWIRLVWFCTIRALYDR